MTNLPYAFRNAAVLVILLLIAGLHTGFAQDVREYVRPNQWSAAAEYSNNSNRIVGGDADQRKWAALTLGYARRVAAGHGVALSYLSEVRPLIVESDPVKVTQLTFTGSFSNLPSATTSEVVASCAAEPDSTTFSVANGTVVGTAVQHTRCSRRWTYGGAVSPVGFRLHAFATRPLQPYLLGTLGVVLTTRPIPAENGTRCNFLIQLGAGVQLYRSPSRSIFAEYRVQHISNDDRSNINPGIDNQVVRLGLQFGR